MTEPKGTLTIQTLAMPSDTNASGDIFGGWLVSQMDLAGAILAKQVAQGRVATVAIHSMSFLKPVQVGSLVSCYVELITIGTTSITVAIEVFAGASVIEKPYRVTEGTFIFVAIDDDGNPRKVPHPL